MSVFTYKCKNCGGELTFRPESQDFGCGYCGSDYTKAELEEKEPNAEAVKESAAKDESQSESEDFDAVMYNCPSCGAEVMTESTTAATYCYYCHNPVVHAGRLSGKYAPNRVIPFKFNRESAIKYFIEMTKKKRFLPEEFYSEKSIEKLTGVYFPYWMIDCDANARIDAVAKRVRRWRTGNTEHTETSTFKVLREGDIHLEDMIKTALNSANKTLVEGVQPFDSRELDKFSMTYLSGFQAEKRDIESVDVEEETNQDIKRYCDELLLETISGYTTRTVENSDRKIKSIDFEYTLLPVWVMTYLYQGQQFFFTMNGQTGKICGKLPVDSKKLLKFSALVSAAVALIMGIGAYLI